MLSSATALLNSPSRRKSISPRRKFLAVSVALLAIAGPMLGMSYLGDSGTTTTTVAASSQTKLVMPIAAATGFGSAFLPTGTSVVLKNGSTTTSGTLPSWSPAAGSPGQVQVAGDLAIVNTIGAVGPVTLNVYITNLVQLAQMYQSYSLPLSIWQCTSATTCTASTWGTAPISSGYLLNSQPNYTVTLAPGYFYSVSMDVGGSYFCTSTTASGGSLSPNFFFSAQAL